MSQASGASTVMVIGSGPIRGRGGFAGEQRAILQCASTSRIPPASRRMKTGSQRDTAGGL